MEMKQIKFDKSTKYWKKISSHTQLFLLLELLQQLVSISPMHCSYALLHALLQFLLVHFLCAALYYFLKNLGHPLACKREMERGRERNKEKNVRRHGRDEREKMRDEKREELRVREKLV